jgi:hypothetical protein
VWIDELQVVQRDEIRERARLEQRIEMRAARLVDAVDVQNADARELQPAAKSVDVDVRVAEVHDRLETAGADVLDDCRPHADVQNVVAPPGGCREVTDVAVRAASRSGGDVQDGARLLRGRRAHRRRRKQMSQTR